MTYHDIPVGRNRISGFLDIICDYTDVGRVYLLASREGKAIIYDQIDEPLPTSALRYTWEYSKKLTLFFNRKNAVWHFTNNGNGMRISRCPPAKQEKFIPHLRNLSTTAKMCICILCRCTFFIFSVALFCQNTFYFYKA